ncbi:MAG: CHASE2 domain-containing protein [Cyanobacteria bacterium P01_D01_bin.56]
MPGVLAAGLTLLTARIGILQSFEQTAYRALFQLRGEQPWNDQVTVIEIDEVSLDAIGPFPWPRRYYTDLLKQLIPAEPSVIAFDILFAESSSDDVDFAQAMARHGNVVLATAWDPQGDVIGPNGRVMEGAIATGHIHNQADSDGITRFYQSQVNGTLALSIKAVQRHYQQLSLSISADSLQKFLWLNWRGTSHTAPRYSFSDVLSGEVPAKTFTNKIIFVGFTGKELDRMTTPYNQNVPTAGVYQHIVAANNLLAQNHLKKLDIPTWPLLIIVGAVFGYWLFYRRFSRQLLGGLIVIVVWCGTVIVAFSYDYWLPIVTPLVTLITTANFVKLMERTFNQECLSESRAASSVALTLHSSIKFP